MKDYLLKDEFIEKVYRRSLNRDIYWYNNPIIKDLYSKMFYISRCNNCILKQHSTKGFSICPVCRGTAVMPIPLSEIL